MITKVKTGKKSTKRRTKAFAAAVMGKPSGQILERVKQATPEHFGIVSVDCAKERSKWMLADFYRCGDDWHLSQDSCSSPMITGRECSISGSRRNEPQQRGTLLVGLLARLGVTIQPPALQSGPLEAPAADSDTGDR